MWRNEPTPSASNTLRVLCVRAASLQTALEARLSIRSLDELKFETLNSICGCGGIGRRAGFRFQWSNSCGFKSRHPHQQKRYSPCGCTSFVYKEGGTWRGAVVNDSLNGCQSRGKALPEGKEVPSSAPKIDKFRQKLVDFYFFTVTSSLFTHPLKLVD